MYLSVLEGVAFGKRDSLEVTRELGIDIKESNICGGGSKSKLWRKIFANVLGIRLAVPESEEGPGYGGAMLAMVGDKQYESVEKCCEALINIKGYEEVNEELKKRYEDKYQKYRKIYPTLKNLFKEL